MDNTKLYNLPGLMVTIDFEKAFDSLSWNFLFNTLEKFNFGESFIKWVRFFYTNISSYIMNNGVATPLFSIGGGGGGGGGKGGALHPPFFFFLR